MFQCFTLRFRHHPSLRLNPVLITADVEPTFFSHRKSLILQGAALCHTNLNLSSVILFGTHPISNTFWCGTHFFLSHEKIRFFMALLSSILSSLYAASFSSRVEANHSSFFRKLHCLERLTSSFIFPLWNYLLVPSHGVSSWTLILQKKRFICFDESPLKMTKSTFYFILEALFVLRIFKFLPWLFRYVEKMTWLEIKTNFKIYGVTTWLRNNYNTHVAQYITR